MWMIQCPEGKGDGMSVNFSLLRKASSRSNPCDVKTMILRIKAWN